MTDLELSAVIALVQQTSAIIHAETSAYGVIQCEPDYTPTRVLYEELERRGVLPKRVEIDDGLLF